MTLPRFSTPPALRTLALRAKIKRLSLDDKPILIGPWRSEVGFEASYWTPLLNWIGKQVPNFWQRAVVVTRGGAACWYHPQVNAVDLYNLRSVDEFRIQNTTEAHLTGLQKQMAWSAWDRVVLKDAARSAFGTADFAGSGLLGLNHTRAYHVLHPSWMYWTFAPFWDEQRGMLHVGPYVEFPPIPAPALPLESWVEDDLMTPQLAQLIQSRKFVAVKLYERATFPDNPMTRDFCKNLLGRITSQMPVVLLHQPGLHVDDHHDIPLSGPNIYQIHAFPVERNLEYLSAILGRAEMFVGTYGGFAQLALRMGVRSLSFYAAWHSTARAHLTLSQAMAVATNVPFVAMSVAEVGMCKTALREKVIEKVVEKVA